MRPLELRLRNFRSYFGEDSVFDFRNRGLVGVVGPIGSGKSSLLDAIAFALYGRTPTVAATTKSLIHQRADGATVRLRFSVDDEVWEVTRALRRKGQSVHGLVHLEADAPEAETLERFVLEGEVNERIVELLGLEFPGFSRSIMLAQGRFAEFLSSKPAERDKVLKGVFGHDRIDLMRTAAKERASAEGMKVETLGVRLEAADALAGRINLAREQLALDEARLELLRKAESKFADRAERVASTGRVISHAESRLAEFEPLAERMPRAEVVADIVAVASSANEARERLGTALQDAQEQLAVADTALGRLEPAELRKKIDEASRLEATVEQLVSQRESLTAQVELGESRDGKLAGRHGEVTDELEEARAAAGVAEAEAAAAVAGQEAAAAALQTAQHKNMAATLRQTIEPGGDCPVCAQPVTLVPKAADAPETQAADMALSEANKVAAAARKRAQSAATEVSRIAEAMAAVAAEAKASLKETAGIRARLKDSEGEAADALSRLKAILGKSTPAGLRKELAAAEAAVVEARKRVDLTRSEHDEAIRSAQAADKELGALRLTLAELATRLAVEIGPTDDIAAVDRAVSVLRDSWVDATETLTTAKTAAEQEQAEIAAADKALRKELQIDGEFSAQLAEVVATADLRRQQIDADEVSLGETDELRRQRSTAEATQTIYATLAGELTDSKFVRYMLDEEKRDLANLGSEHFERLSSGRYRFSDDGEFRIVDLTSADAVRKADSLSGGETFLASLALALALAEMVARTGGRLDAFFLDEGFGSLDLEHLDLAMEGIEQLAAGDADRLVLVVSHVPDMRDRLEDLIVLDRDPVTGDTVVIHS